MMRLIKASVTALSVWALALAPLCAQEAIIGSGAWGGGAVTQAYVQNSVHLGQGAWWMPVTTTFTASNAIATTNTGFQTGASCPTGWALGQAIIDMNNGGAGTSQGPTAVIGYVGNCAGSSPATMTGMLLSATVNSGGSYSAHNAQGTMTWTGTGCTTNPVLKVQTNGSGVINAIGAVSGVCQTLPSNSDSADWTPSGLGTVTTAATFNVGSPIIHAGNSGDSLKLSGPVASQDNCQFIFSGWWRGNDTAGASTTNYNNDFFSAGRTLAGASSESELGIDMVFDSNGLRLNSASKNLTTFSPTVDGFGPILGTAGVTADFKFGQWTHILWTENVCDLSSPGNQYSQLYINGVQALSTHLSTTNTFTAPINFANPAGGFTLGKISGGGLWSWGEWADVMLWTGTDLVCQHGTWTSGCPLGGTSISSADLALFGQSVGGVWVPKNPSVAVAGLDLGVTDGSRGLLIELTGNASSWNTNLGHSATPYQLVQPATSSAAWTDVPGSASRVTSSFPSGNPAHRAGWQWACAIGATNQSTLATSSCGQTITAGDLLVAYYIVSNSTGAFACPPPTGWTNQINSYNATANMFDCVNTYVARSSETGAYSVAIGANGSRVMVILVDYGPGSFDVAGAMSSYSSSGTNITAPSLTTTAANDVVIGLFLNANTPSAPNVCPAAMSPRLNFYATGAASGNWPGVLLCEMTQSAIGATGTQTATKPGTGQYSAGVLLSIKGP